MESIKDVWSSVLNYLKNHKDISEVAYDVWITQIEPKKMDDGHVIVSVATDFQKKIIKEHYSSRITEAFENVLGIPLGLKIICSNQDSSNRSLPTDVKDFLDDDSFEKGSEYEYSFENFIVGSSNKFAHAAAQAVASRPAGYYNPLFIYGRSGLGKTHLLYAICNEIRKNYPDFKIIYTKAEYITNELIEAISTGSTAEFRAKYRLVDILLVDDIQFIAGKVSTQEEFFHTFEALHQNNKQIVLTSDRPPKEISTLEDRLLNRFEMGLLADVQSPDFETRIAIIKRKAKLCELNISDKVAEYIATQIKSNVRQLEGAIKRMRAQYLLAGEEPNMIAAQNAIRDMKQDDQPSTLTVEYILSEIARTMNVTPDEIKSSKRSSQISIARQVSAYIIREITSLPMKAIGDELGNRDHSTVVYAIQKVEQKMEKDSSFRNMIEDIIKNINGK